MRLHNLYTYLVAALFLSGCMGAKVRYDAAPSPVDLNQHTVLMETDCGDGVNRAGYGQAGCSWGNGEKPSGRVVIHTPLPGSIALISRACGIDKTDFHNDKGGSFQYDLAPLFPDGPSSCIIDVFVSWQLPKNLTSEYPLRGMLGKIYLRRRGPGQTPAKMQWSDGREASGVAWAQFREVASESAASREPLSLTLMASRPVVDGSFRLFGCGQGVPGGDFEGDRVLLSREQIVGPSPKKGGCLMFGFLVGERGVNNDDLTVGVEVFGYKAMKVAASVTVTGNKVCYDAEDAVSLAVLNYAGANQGSNKVSDCFTLPDGTGIARLGLFTHQGRALYALIENGAVKEIMQ